MKCANCGAEIRVGCVYCSACGKEAQIVSDYNLLEDDFLRGVLKEKEEETFGKNAAKLAGDGRGEATMAKREEARGQEPEEPDRKKQRAHEKKKTAKPVAGKHKKGVSLKWSLFSIAALAALIAVLAFASGYANQNSYGYQMGQAAKYEKEGDYAGARECLSRALELDSSSVEARFSLAEIQLLQDEPLEAAETLKEIIKEDGENREAYAKLIRIYADRKDYDSILGLFEDAGKEVRDLFDDYLADPPALYPEGGDFTLETEIRISCEEGCTAYYTTDGSDPKQGTAYSGPISAMPGDELLIRAVACNEYGIYSEETAGTYRVARQKPAPPRVTPDGGNFSGPQSISVYVPEGCEAYYTWDGSVPTERSARYSQPIAVPEGNNILSVILVDQYGMSSDVTKCNFIYMPVPDHSPS